MNVQGYAFMNFPHQQIYFTFQTCQIVVHALRYTLHALTNVILIHLKILDRNLEFILRPLTGQFQIK